MTKFTYIKIKFISIKIHLTTNVYIVFKYFYQLQDDYQTQIWFTFFIWLSYNILALYIENKKKRRAYIGANWSVIESTSFFLVFFLFILTIDWSNKTWENSMHLSQVESWEKNQFVEVTFLYSFVPTQILNGRLQVGQIISLLIDIKIKPSRYFLTVSS